MIPIMDFQERSLTGPVKKADEFDIEFSMKLRELVANHGIRFHNGQLIPDDATADAVFEAGVNLLANVGLYHLDTQRVIQYTREEILTFIGDRRENPGKAHFGRGNDHMILEYRTGDDVRPPTLYSGPAGVIDEDFFVPFIQSFAQEQTIKGLGIVAGLERLGNIMPKAGTLSEVHVGLWEQARLQEVLRNVERPGMNLGLLCTVSTFGATAQCIREGLREPYNTQIGVHIIPDQKINWERLLLANFCRDRGIVPWQSAMAMIGGLCRNAEDAAVALVANMLGQMSYAHGPACSLFASHMDGSGATPATIRAVSAAARAAERNVRIAVGSTTQGSYKYRNNPIAFVQGAAVATALTASGLAYSWRAGHTALEARLTGEVLNATAGMKRERANELANAILSEADAKLSQVGGTPEPKQWVDVYDPATLKPKPEYEDALQSVKTDLARIGIPYH